MQKPAKLIKITAYVRGETRGEKNVETWLLPLSRGEDETSGNLPLLDEKAKALRQRLNAVLKKTFYELIKAHSCCR